MRSPSSPFWASVCTAVSVAQLGQMYLPVSFCDAWALRSVPSQPQRGQEQGVSNRQVKEVVLRPQDGHFSTEQIVPQSRQIICDFMIDSPLNMRQILALFAVPV